MAGGVGHVAGRAGPILPGVLRWQGNSQREGRVSGFPQEVEGWRSQALLRDVEPFRRWDISVPQADGKLMESPWFARCSFPLAVL